jgi:hypothetical protein
MVCAATGGAVTATRSAVASSPAVVSAATPTATVEPTASTTATVEAATTSTATMEAATTSTAVAATTMLRESSRRGKQRHGSDCAKQNLDESGPVHVCYLHPTSTQEVQVAPTSRPFYNN